MLDWPAANPAVGVNTAVRVRLLPVMAPSVPPLTTKSPVWVVAFHARLVLGSSLKVKVRVAV